MTSPQFPEPQKPSPPPSIDGTSAPASKRGNPFEEVDAKVARLASTKDAWPKVGIPERIAYLRKCIDGVLEVSAGWVADGCRAKGIAEGDTLAGEEWVVGPWQTIRNARLLILALEQAGQPKVKVVARPDGQLVAKVFPLDLKDKLMFGGYQGELWIEPGKPATQGATYREPAGPGRVALVLGAGNVSSIGPMDAFYKLFVDNEVVVLKMNPVNAWVGPHLERALRCLIDDGYLAIVYGGADVGAHLAEHPKVDTLHVTGSDRTYDAIVWGTDPAERERRKAASDPKNTRPFTAELGCVTPVLVVPGPWSHADLDFQARQIAGMVAQNASFNCNAAKVVVVAKGWPQRAALLAKIETHLKAARPRKAYYPGAQDRYKAFLDHYPAAKPVGETGADVVPWTVIPDVPPAKGEYALTNEAFCGVLAEVTLDATTPQDFMAKATAFANDDCWGTLSCTVLVHPSTERDYPADFDRMVAGLRYGGIGINCWGAMVYALVSTTWGAFPGHSPKDIQSGSGVVHNALLFDHPQKSVARAPFRIFPIPVWFADHRNLAKMAKKLTSLEASPSWGKLLGVAMEALKA
jgi:acyl-CoA reductase-like NAD-dependent aldehyde dehydrogenase